MPKTTRVARLTGIKEVGLFNEKVDDPSPGQVLVEIKSVGLCGSDYHYYLHGGLGTFAAQMPMEIGHEAAGKIIAVGEGCSLSVGDRIAVEPVSCCNKCPRCKDGRFNLCMNAKFLGTSGAKAAFRDYMLLDEKQLIKIPDEMSYDEAALLEPMAVVYHALNRAVNENDKSLFIYGAGPIGLLMALVAPSFGIEKIYMVDYYMYRAEFAKSLGVTFVSHVFDEVASFMNEDTGGIGPDVSVDVCGAQASIEGCIKATRSGGKIIIVGIPCADALAYNPHKCRIKELTIYNSRWSNMVVHQCIDLIISGKVKGISSLITHKFELSEIQTAYEESANYLSGGIKTIINPQHERVITPKSYNTPWWPTDFIEEDLIKKDPSLISTSENQTRVRQGGADILTLGPDFASFIPDVFITIAIGSWNRTPYLSRILHQYSQQEYPKNLFKIVIADDNSDDFKYYDSGSPVDVAHYCKELYPAMNIELYQTHEDFGAANVRWNVGVSRSEDGLVIVNESDVLPVGKLFLKKYAYYYKKWISNWGNRVFANPLGVHVKATAHWSYNKFKQPGFFYDLIQLSPSGRCEHDYCLGMDSSLAHEMRGFWEPNHEPEQVINFGAAESNLFTRLISVGGRVIALRNLFVIHLPNMICTLECWNKHKLPYGQMIYNNSFCANDETWGNPPLLTRIEI